NNGNRGGAPSNSNGNGGVNPNQPAAHDNPMTPQHEGGNSAPQTQRNNDQERYRYTPPVRANDQNYDVHPPLNQNRSQSQPSRPQAQPCEQHPQQHQAAPKENKQSSHDNNNNRHQ